MSLKGFKFNSVTSSFVDKRVLTLLAIFLLFPFLVSGQDIDHFGSTAKPIINGSFSPPQSYPFLVSLGDFDVEEFSEDLEPYWSHRCGATVIHPRYLLTAAHCNLAIKKASVGSVYPDRGRFIDIDAVLSHPDYSYMGNYNDIALVRLQEPLSLPIVQLPDSEFSAVEESTTAWLAGWGRISLDSWRLPKRLKHGEVNLITNSECRDVFNSEFPEGHNSIVEITDSMICGTMIGNKDPQIPDGAAPCHGDSGGPMLVARDQGLVQIGIASFAIPDCGERGSFFAYTRISSFLAWIEDVTLLGDEFLESVMRLRGLVDRASKLIRVKGNDDLNTRAIKTRRQLLFTKIENAFLDTVNEFQDLDPSLLPQFTDVSVQSLEDLKTLVLRRLKREVKSEARKLALQQKIQREVYKLFF